MLSTDWRVGSKLVHPYDTELGVGVVRSIEGRYLEVYFPAIDRELTMAAEAGLRRLVLQRGQSAILIDSGRRKILTKGPSRLPVSDTSAERLPICTTGAKPLWKMWWSFMTGAATWITTKRL